MANPPLQLVIGNYNTSSWSLRASLVLRLARLAFTEIRVPLRRPETPERIARYSPSGKLPVLIVEGVPIWDSLAIAEFTAELEPGIWPIDPVRRAEARSISAEMHSGFAELRRLMPMDVVSRFTAPGRLPRRLDAEIERVKTIWRLCRERYAADGPFLFGAFSVADAMVAPVATRLVTHGVPIDGAVEDYVDSVMAWPDMVAWCDAAAAEQDERTRQGSLGVIETIVPGRILNGDGEATEPDWHQPSPAEGRQPPEPLQPRPAEARPQPAAAAATTTDEPEPPAAAAAEAMPETAEEASDTSPLRAEADEQGAPESPPESATEPPVAVADHPASPARQETPQETRREPALPPLPPLEPKGRAERPPAMPQRKLGWIRRPVPQEHLDEVEERAPPSHPLRRTALGTEAAAKRDDGAALRPDKLRPIDRPAAALPADERDEERSSSGKTGHEGTGGRPEPERQDASARPPAPSVKPIGGGILRRR